jgi:FkbM family methyltransferase
MTWIARIRPYVRVLRDLHRYRFHFTRRRDWLWLMCVSAVHALSGPLGLRGVHCRVRLPADPRPVTIRLGTADFRGLVEVYLQDVYAFATPALTSLVPPVSMVVDLGANIGLTVRLWSRLFPAATIIVVEPDAENITLCATNASAVHERVKFFRCFVADMAGSAAIDRTFGTWAYRMSRLGGSPEGEAIVVRTMPDIISEADLGATQIDLLKCDIEGTEAALFRGGPAWLRRVRAILAEVHGSYTPADLAADVHAAGGCWDATVALNVVLLVRRSGSPQSSPAHQVS